jgi:hypothetical protein
MITSFSPADDAPTLQILHKHGVLQSVFSQWFQLLYKTPKKGAQQAEAAAAAAAAGEKLKRKNFSKCVAKRRERREFLSFYLSISASKIVRDAFTQTDISIPPRVTRQAC